MQIEQVKDARSLEEMRAEIFRLERYDPTVRKVMDIANFRGMSAEDRFTALAYYALRERALLQKAILDDAMARPAPPMMPPNDRVEGRDAASSRRVPSHDGLCGVVDTENGT